MKKSILTTLLHTIIIAALSGLVGCGPPLEPRRPITAEKSPLLPEPEDDENPMAVLHAGDLVEVIAPVTKLDWKGRLDGQPAERHGDLVTLRRATGETAAFGFVGDIGDTVKVPTAAWLCHKMAAPRECETRLRRTRLGDLLIAYDPCIMGTCRAAVVRNNRVEAVSIDGLSDLNPATLEGQQVLIASTRWVRDASWTGATTLVYRVNATLDRALSINTEEIDGRHPPAIHRMGTLSIEGGVLTFRGTRREIAPAIGAILTSRPIVEAYRLAK